MKGKGNASRKGSTVKDNTNANDRLDLAADPSTEPKEYITPGMAEVRAQEAPENEAATQRPEK